MSHSRGRLRHGGRQWLFARPGFQPPPQPVMPPLNFGRTYLQTTTESQTLIINGITYVNVPSSIDLATDMVNSSIGPPENFDNARGGFPMPHHAAHMGRNRKPAGGNILYLDNHAAWRDFTEMRIQLQDSGNNYYF